MPLRRSSPRSGSNTASPIFTSRCGDAGGGALRRSKRAAAQHQLARLEGLGQIIVGAVFQARDAVLGFAARGEHQDRHLRLRAHGLCQIEPGFARHHHVEDQKIERHALHQGAGFCGIGRGADAKAVGAQILLQQRAQALVVVDHEQMRIVGRGTHGFASARLAFGVGQCRQHTAEAQHGVGSRLAEGAREPRALRFPKGRFQRFALRGQPQLAHAAIVRRRAPLDETLAQKIVQHPIEALLGDLEDRKQGGDREPRIAGDEVERAMMGAAQPCLAQAALALREQVAKTHGRGDRRPASTPRPEGIEERQSGAVLRSLRQPY